MANAFQQGQQAQLDIEKEQLANEAAASTQAGINALADIFGETARAPREKVALEGAASREEQRGIENVRQKRQDELAEQKIDTVRRARAGRQTVAFIKQGLKNGATMEQILAKAGPAIMALGATEEEIGQLPDMIAADPSILDQFEAAFAATEKSVARRATGNPIPIRQADGTVGMLQSFSDGSQEFTPGVTTVAAEQAGERVEQGAQRITQRAAPAQRGISEAKAEGKAVGTAKGEVLAEDIDRSERETAKSKIALAQRQQRADFVNAKIEEALGQANNWTAGLGSILKVVPGTPQANLASTIDTIKANVGFDELQRLRDNSKTGGALGQVSERENVLLQSVLGALEQSQSPAQFKRNLENLKEQLALTQDRIAEAWEADYGTTYGGAGSPIPGAGTEGIDELLQKYGIE